MPITRCLALLLGGLSLLGPGAVQGQTPPGPAGQRPNIVLIFTDDMGYGDLSSFGNPTIRTPRLDEMAREGIRLTSFYAAAPVCTPSRAALLTGRYPIRSGTTGNFSPNSTTGLPPTEVTLAEALKARGYRTAAIGKWHLGHLPRFLPTAQGFDSYFGIPFSNDYMPPWVADMPGPVPLMRDTAVVERPVDQTTLTRRYTEEAVRIIRESRGQPFFMYLAHAMPHLPIHASASFRGRSRGGLYGDVVEELDWSVGTILDALREAGLERNTIVVFTSDNGPWLDLPARMLQGGVEPWHTGSPGPLRGAKGTTWEGGMRVPAVVRWPGVIPAGQVSAEIASTMDLYTTLITAAGGAVPQDRPVDGRNILPFLAGSAPSPREELFYFSARALEAVREGMWKLRVARGGGTEAAPALFHLGMDPAERYDVAAAHPEVVERLRRRMSSFAKELGATLIRE